MITLPPNRRSGEEVLDAMRRIRANDAKWHEGKTWSLVFHAGDEVTDLLREAYNLFFSENGLNPMAFPSLKKFEAEVVAMTGGLLGGDDLTVGNMTSGGTESILLAVKTARDWARSRKPAVTSPELLLPSTAHPAFDKAAHYFCVKAVRVPVAPDYRAVLPAMRDALTPNTISIKDLRESVSLNALERDLPATCDALAVSATPSWRAFSEESTAFALTPWMVILFPSISVMRALTWTSFWMALPTTSMTRVAFLSSDI
jgi:glutamate/tyrosine decarboxylase-like PLP-dependent enzyme